MNDKRLAQIEKIKILERQQEMTEGLPFLYGWKHYGWSRKFFESTNHENFLVAANQVGKSSVNIRKCIHWATETTLWPELWNTTLLGKPNQFWYFYPTRDVATIEFKTKWSLFLPSGKFKNDLKYGWYEEMERKQIVAIHFNSGVSVYFKTYSQKSADLQTGTVFALFGDEEMPLHLLPELQARLNASDGYFHLVFTATLGQEHWRRTMEERGELEKHKGALKINASLYDCLEFEDGSPSHWTADKIRRAELKCPTKAEVQRRIYGRFVVSDGLVYQSFEHDRNKCQPHPIPENWAIFSAVDVGSGGETGHPAAIIFLAVSPDYMQGRVFRGWRGDGIPTEPGDILAKYRGLRGSMRLTDQVYDWASKDFYTIASRVGEGFTRAEKSHEIGEGVLNTLFRHGMLKIFTGDTELDKLVAELTSLHTSTPKNKAQDDLVDALRYAVMAVPWDFSAIDVAIDLEVAFQKQTKVVKKKILTPEEEGDKIRASWAQSWRDGQGQAENDIEAELRYWQDEYGT